MTVEGALLTEDETAFVARLRASLERRSGFVSYVERKASGLLVVHGGHTHSVVRSFVFRVEAGAAWAVNDKGTTINAYDLANKLLGKGWKGNEKPGGRR